MSSIETLQRDWAQSRRRLDEACSEDGRDEIYDIDRKDDDPAIESINLDFVRSAVEQRSGRIDNKVITLATLA
ncbi:hypothetical protein, partial [Streptomyces sp. SID12501]